MTLIYTFEEILNCLQISSLLEVSGYPKPGNVHRTRDYLDTRFEHFLVAAVVIRRPLRLLCEKVVAICNKSRDYSKIEMGKYIALSLEETIRWQRGGNINLGIILLLAPLCATASALLDNIPATFNDYRSELDKIIKKSTSNDTIEVYKAINLVHPGGMGVVGEFDLNDSNSLKEIENRNLNLHDIFFLAKDRDSIAREWVSRFEITFEIGLPYFMEIFEESKDINVSTVNTFLKILSEVPDTLIARKHGIEKSKEFSENASEILNNGGLKNQNNKKELLKWEKSIIESDKKINPGTTADLLVSTLFISLLSKIRY
jgi:triphosphoribosyl-dephospho-CoA synthase